jgi:hypothetical protein
MFVEEIIPDPDRPHTADILLEDEETMRLVRRAAAIVPVMLDSIPVDHLDRLLEKLTRHRNERYMISIGEARDDRDIRDAVALIRSRSQSIHTAGDDRD